MELSPLILQLPIAPNHARGYIPYTETPAQPQRAYSPCMTDRTISSYPMNNADYTRKASTDTLNLAVLASGPPRMGYDFSRLGPAPISNPSISSTAAYRSPSTFACREALCAPVKHWVMTRTRPQCLTLSRINRDSKLGRRVSIC